MSAVSAKQPVRKKAVDMTEGNIWRQIILFAIPILLSNSLQQLYNIMDSVIVGQYVGAVALAAVGSTTSTVNLFIGFFVGLSTGAGVVISQYYGAQEYKKMHDTVHTAVALAIIAGIVLGIAGVLASPFILKLINTPDDVFGMAVSYLRITFAGMIFTTIYNIGGGILRAVGDSKRPLYYLAVCAVLNVVLNLLFVVGFNWGVNGVAWATIIAQAVSAALVMINLIHTTLPHKVVIKDIRIHIEKLKEVVRIGVPAGCQSIVISLSNVIIQSFVNRFGSIAMAGFAAAHKIDAFIWMPTNAIDLTATTFAGQNIGAKKFDRVKHGIKVCMVIGIGVTAVIGIAAAFSSEFLVSLLNSEPEVISYGAPIVAVLGATYWLLALSGSISGTIRGSGNAIMPMIISLSCMCAFRILWLAVLIPIFPSMSTIALCYPASWILNAAVFMIYMVKGNWLRKHEQAAA